MRRTTSLAALSCAAFLTVSCGGSGGDPAGTQPSGTPTTTAATTAATSAAPAAPAAVASAAPAAVSSAAPAAEKVVATQVATGLRSPWGLAFLPDGRSLVTEKGGTLRIVSLDGAVSAPIGGGPAVDTNGQGGLLDVKLSPDFANDSTIWFAFAEPAGGGFVRTAVARAVLRPSELESVQVVFRQQPAITGGLHFGARLAFAPDGTLFVGLGERGQGTPAQALDNHLGKVVRIRPDGSVPADNPFVGRAGALPEIWSYGHRNIQGAAIEPSSGRLWIVEHGPQGGDEVNVPDASANHGWPEITYGRDYSTGEPLGQGTTRADVAPPLHYWVPTSIAPAGIAFVTSSRVPAWTGDLFVGALAGRMLVRLDVQDGRVVGEQRLLTSLGERIRDVKQGPDGALYFVTDSTDGRLMRVDVR
jgi:glucose/arabinose dehydrogenase